MSVKIIGRLTDEGETILLSLYSDKVRAGFPSPATDYVQNRIDLNTLLIHSPTTTYLVEVEGDSMIDIGIYPNDILIVDRSISARNKDIVIALVDDGFTAKQLILGEHIILRAHNINYSESTILILSLKVRLSCLVWWAVVLGGLSVKSKLSMTDIFKAQRYE